MFQFSGFATITGQYTFSILGCPIRKSLDQCVFATPQSLSQLITSFIASKSRGILHTPLVTFFVCAYTRNFFILATALKGVKSVSRDLLSVKIVSLVSFYQYVKERFSILLLNLMWRITDSNR